MARKVTLASTLEGAAQAAEVRRRLALIDFSSAESLQLALQDFGVLATPESLHACIMEGITRHNFYKRRATVGPRLSRQFSKNAALAEEVHVGVLKAVFLALYPGGLLDSEREAPSEQGGPRREPTGSP